MQGDSILNQIYVSPDWYETILMELSFDIY